MNAIGIDHFAVPGDELEVASSNGQLRRNFQGYAADTCQSLIGLGASSISQFPGGYIQNAPATAAYIQRIGAGGFAGSQRDALTRKDRLRARAIERLTCEFRIDLTALRTEVGKAADTLRPVLGGLSERFGDLVRLEIHCLEITSDGRALTRITAVGLDQHAPDRMTYSRAS